MKREERYERGDRLIEDATFIKNIFIPEGWDAKRWNVVVFEAYRVSELYIKALFYYSGYSPRESHELNVIVDDLCSLLEKEKWNVPFVYSLVAKGGDCYGIRLMGNQLSFFKRISNTYTELGDADLSAVSTDDLVKITIAVDGPELIGLLGEKIIFKTSDASLTQSLKLQRTLVKPSDKERIDKLKSLLSELRETREQAFYSERLFTEAESSEAVEKMNGIIELSKVFLVHENLI